MPKKKISSWATSRFDALSKEQTWYWHPWQNVISEKKGVTVLGGSKSKRLMVTKIMTKDHPVIGPLAIFRPPYIIGIWTIPAHQFVGFIVAERSLPGLGNSWYLRTYRKIMNGKKTGLLQHSYHFNKEPSKSDLDNLIKHELDATKKRKHSIKGEYYGF